MASKKQYAVIGLFALWGGGSGALGGVAAGPTGMVAGLLGGLLGGALFGYVLVAAYNSWRGPDEVLTVEDVQ